MCTTQTMVVTMTPTLTFKPLRLPLTPTSEGKSQFWNRRKIQKTQKKLKRSLQNLDHSSSDPNGGTRFGSRILPNPARFSPPLTLLLPRSSSLRSSPLHSSSYPAAAIISLHLSQEPSRRSHQLGAINRPRRSPSVGAIYASPEGHDRGGYRRRRRGIEEERRDSAAPEVNWS